MCGSLSTDAYLCAADPENTATFYSVNHGSGSIEGEPPKGQGDSAEAFVRRVESTYRIRLYKGKTTDVAKADPRNFRNIEAAIRTGAQNHMFKPVCALAPLMSFKD